MKRIELPLSRLSFAQKLNLMEAIWADLTRYESKLESPAWHENILNEREEAFESGKETVSNWKQAKKRIKKKVS